MFRSVSLLGDWDYDDDDDDVDNDTMLYVLSLVPRPVEEKEATGSTEGGC